MLGSGMKLEIIVEPSENESFICVNSKDMWISFEYFLKPHNLDSVFVEFFNFIV